jgi:hypothetical protein
MKPDAITALFADASVHFIPFACDPTDDDIPAIHEVLTPLLLCIPYDADGRHNLVGLIAQRDKYKTKYSVFFARPKRPLFYDDTLDAAATPVVRARAEAIQTAKLTDYAAFEAAKRAVVKFNRTAVDETWYKDLKDSESFYNAVTAADLIDHLNINCGGLHAIDLVNLPTEMLAYYAAAEGIPEYINMLEDAQRKAQLAAMPIADVQLVAIASTAVLGSQQYPVPPKTGRRLPPPPRPGRLGRRPTMPPTSLASANSLHLAPPSHSAAPTLPAQCRPRELSIASTAISTTLLMRQPKRNPPSPS